MKRFDRVATWLGMACLACSTPVMALSCVEPMVVMTTMSDMYEEDGSGRESLAIQILDGDKELTYFVSAKGEVSNEQKTSAEPVATRQYNVFEKNRGITYCGTLRISSDSPREVEYMQDALVSMLHGICNRAGNKEVLRRFANLRMLHPAQEQVAYHEYLDSISRNCPAMMPILHEVRADESWAVLQAP